MMGDLPSASQDDDVFLGIFAHTKDTRDKTFLFVALSSVLAVVRVSVCVRPARQQHINLASRPFRIIVAADMSSRTTFTHSVAISPKTFVFIRRVFPL